MVGKKEILRDSVVPLILPHAMTQNLGFTFRIVLKELSKIVISGAHLQRF